MFKFLSRLFSSGRSSAPVRNIEKYDAAIALLVEAATVDGIYSDLEEDVIMKLITDSFAVAPSEAPDMLARAEQLANDAVDAHALTRHVKKLEESERASLIEAMYRVALADGEACKFEQAFVRHVASLLHIDDVTRAKARRRAERNET
ncbi:MAG: hypothetical protein CME93_02760 [Hyphomonadaceae bacterium]|nr:hypothetical protein [Hyphomonadaceae bacterium]